MIMIDMDFEMVKQNKKIQLSKAKISDTNTCVFFHIQTSDIFSVIIIYYYIDSFTNKFYK